MKSSFRFLASVKLAVPLLAALAAVLGWATFLEAGKGREYAQTYVYGSGWFIALLAVLGVNVLAATLIRFPWNRRQTGFVVTHAGILVLLAGAIQTFRSGVEGHVSLRPGQQTDRLVRSDQSLVTVLRPANQGRSSTAFSFQPGPGNWRDGRTLDFGAENGLGLKVLKFYRHAREHREWVADDLDYQGPALRLLLSGPSGNAVAEDWLAANLFGGEAVIGATKYDLLPLPVAAMLDDFRQPPSDLGQRGVLAIHYQGRVQRVNVDEHVGKKIAVDDAGLAVEIVEYLANARPSPDGRFVARNDTPDNALLDLRIHQPGQEKPLRQVAFAKRPLLTLDGVHGRECPVKFWFHHAGAKPVPGVLFAQTPEGRLYCRAAVQGAYEPAREVKSGDRIALGGQFTVSLVQHLTRAREEISFQPLEPTAGDSAGPEAAALLEVTLDGHSRRVWLQREDQQLGFQTLLTAGGLVEVVFGYDTLPLGYTLQLKEFTRQQNPGRLGNAAFSSTVRLRDEAAQVDREQVISMNQPLTYGKFSLYQSSFQEAPGHGTVSVLTAACDPGRFLKYAGSLMICAGMLLMFLLRASLLAAVPVLVPFRRPAVAGELEQAKAA